MVCITGIPQGTVLARLQNTLYTLDLCYSSELCQIQKFTNGTAIIRNDRGVCRGQLKDFVSSSDKNNPQLNILKTKELLIDLGNSRKRRCPELTRVTIGQLQTNTSTSGCGWTRCWTGHATQTTCTRRARAHCTSCGDCNLLTSARNS